MKLELTVDGKEKGVVLYVLIIVLCAVLVSMSVCVMCGHTYRQRIKPLPPSTTKHPQDQVLGDAAEPRAGLPPLVGPQGDAPPRGQFLG